jgi:Domain of unknown function (DUF4837)
LVRRAAALLALVLLAGPGCSGGKRIPAVGPAHEIVVLAPKGMKVLSDEVAKVLGAEVVTVRHEPRFDIVQDVLEDYRYYKTRKLLLAVGPRSDKSFRKLLDRATGKRTATSYPGLWIETDPFAVDQVLFWLAGDPQQIVRTLRTRGDELIDVVENATEQLIVRSLYSVGEQPRARATLRDRYGWGVRLPPDWTVEDRSSADTKFVRIWHDAPVEQMFVSWEDGNVKRTPDEWLERRHELVWYHYDRDQVVFDHSQAKAGPTPFGRDGVELTGLWENNQVTIGGPFEAWAFYCEVDSRTYLVDLSVYAPDRPKLPLQRVLRAVARTFRCGCSAPPSASAPSGDADGS